MTIRALSSVNNQTFLQKQQKQTQKNNTAQSFAGTYKLPDYKVSFGMARLDMLMLLRNQEIIEEFFTPDSDGYIPAFKMNAKELSKHLDELEKKAPGAAYRLLTTTNKKNGENILHNAYYEKQKVVHDRLSAYSNKSSTFATLYLNHNDKGELPAHRFTCREQIKLMKKVLHNQALKMVLTHETYDSKQLPSHVYSYRGNDFLQSEVIKIFNDDKETLKSIFLHEDSSGEIPVVHASDAVQELMKNFKEDSNFLESYFFVKPKDAKKDDEKVIRSCFDGTNFPILHKELIDANPVILKELYTLRYSNGQPVAENKQHAENIMQLVTDSDLDEKDSLEVLRKNKDILKAHEIEYVDFIQSYLAEQVRRRYGW